MIDEDLPVIEFNATMRCDRCGAQAYTMAVHEDYRSELLLCIHHRKEHVNALMADGFEIIDDYESMSNLYGDNTVPAV